MSSASSTKSSRCELPWNYQITAFNIPDLPAMTFPPLPPITNNILYNTVTTHSSLNLDRKRSMDLNPTRMIEDYEKLEHVGDALLGAMVTILLHDLFPCLGEGPATALKSNLVSNATLARISDAYKISDKLQAQPGALRLARAQVKTRASMFEAWIAGVFYSALDAAARRDAADHEEGYEAGDEARPGAGLGDESEDEQDDAGCRVAPRSEEATEIPSMAFTNVDCLKTMETGSIASTGTSASSRECDQTQRSASPSESSEQRMTGDNTTSDTTRPIIVKEPEETVEPSAEGAPVTDSTITFTESDPELAILPKDKRKYRWLAMIALDEWLRPLFTPIAHYALAELRVEADRLAGLPKPESAKLMLPPAIVAEDLTAVGAAGLLNVHVQQHKSGSIHFEHTQDEKGWRVVCTLTRTDGSRLIGEGVRGNQKTAKALAAQRVCQQLGI